jgi:hypothetical protein
MRVAFWWAVSTRSLFPEYTTLTGSRRLVRSHPVATSPGTPGDLPPATVWQAFGLHVTSEQ